MLEYFRIFADSNSIAAMVIAFMVAFVALYFIRWLKQSDEQDKAYRSKQAIVVRERESDY